MPDKTESAKNELLKRLHDSIAKGDEKFRYLVEGIKDYSLFVIDSKGYIESWNEGAKNIIGYTEEEILGKHFSLFYPKEARDQSLPKYNLEHAKKEGRFEQEGIRLRKDGSTFYANTIIAPIYDKEKKLIGFSTTISDLTEKKQEAKKLALSEEKYRLLVNEVPDYAIYMISPQGLVQTWNEGAKRINGYSEEEIIGKHFSLFYPLDAQEKLQPEFELQQAKKKNAVQEEGWRVRKDGSKYYASISITALYNAQKELIGYSLITKDLSDKKIAEEQLVKSEQKYRLLVEGVKDYAIFMLDPTGIVVSWNEGAKKLKRYEEWEILGEHFSKFYTPEAKERAFPAFELEQAKKSGRFEADGWRVRKDGTVFFANVVITAIYDRNRNLLGYSKITKDLTERKEWEEELRKSEQKHRLLVEGVKDYAIFMLDPRGYIESWNEGARRLKGYNEREILGMHFSIFYPKATRDSGFPEFELEQAKKTGRFEDEGIRIRKDGSTFFANVVITAIYDNENKLIGYSKITRDLTDKKETEELLKKSEEKYRLLVEGVKEYAIFMLDRQGYIASWNEGARRLKKYEEKEVIGKHISIFYPEEKRKEGYPQYELEQAALKGKFEDEGLRVRKDGSTFYANVVITAIYNNNKLIGFSKITRDLTERKQAEDSVNKLNQELEQRVSERTEELSRTVNELKKINADLDNFIYTASHDLKAPVSNIEGLMYALSKTLHKYNYENPEINTLLEMISKSIVRFQVTIKDLAAINESQRSDKEDQINIRLSEVIEDVIVSIDLIVRQSNAKIEMELVDQPTFRFSKVHIRSIVYNLLTNAIKYRSPKRDLIISIKSYVEDSSYILEVGDNGLGIKEENKDKVFLMFKRLHRHVEGSGVGLYIVRRIVDNAGGRIEVQSEVDKGTTFKVYLPLKGQTGEF